MTRAPDALSVSGYSSRLHLTAGRRNNPAKTDVEFRDNSRKQDAALLELVFPGRSQSEISRLASRDLGISQRQIVNYLQGEHDMPSWLVKALRKRLNDPEKIVTYMKNSGLPEWAIKAAQDYCAAVDRTAIKIKGNK